jgi:hypothetical protein
MRVINSKTVIIISARVLTVDSYTTGSSFHVASFPEINAYEFFYSNLCDFIFDNFRKIELSVVLDNMISFNHSNNLICAEYYNLIYTICPFFPV